MSQYCFIAGFPERDILPVPSIVVEPEFIRWMIPPCASPVSDFPVILFTAAGLQKVRTSENIWAVPVN